MAKLRDGRLSCRDIRGRCRREQPARQNPFSRAQARRRQQLEHRAAAEQVQVRGVGMFLRLEGGASRPRAGPSVFDARQAPVVESHGPPGTVSGHQHPVVQDRDGDEQVTGQPASLDGRGGG
jgi:hypothetical protein